MKAQAMKRGVLAVACLAQLGISACSHVETEVKTPSFDEQLPRPTLNYASGSIWQASSMGLAEDLKARRRGDIITVVISESASASKQASTGTGRSSSISAGVPNLFGLETTGIRNWQDLSKLISASYESKFAGSGSTTRQENLQATITAKVVDVIPNGNFLIEGKRNVKVNNEDQIIILTGTVRSRDVSSDNTISSALIADAKITYSGKGIISDRQKPGWLLNAVDAIWPF